jgi:D-arabinose 1-dehydrogenase-like Zn-dependent alcohol dehydrogenase
MKAAVLREPGARFEITDLTLRALGRRDVQVRIAASGVCRSDLSIQFCASTGRVSRRTVAQPGLGGCSPRTERKRT